MTPAYLAGLFDGEGSIRIQSYGGTNFKVRCCLVNCHLPVMRAIVAAYGGRFHVRSARALQKNHRQSFAIQWDGTQIVERLLRTIQPFAIIKRAEIDVVLNEFIPQMQSGTRGALPPSVVAARMEMKTRLSLMKRVVFSERAS